MAKHNSHKPALLANVEAYWLGYVGLAAVGQSKSHMSHDVGAAQALNARSLGCKIVHCIYYDLLIETIASACCFVLHKCRQFLLVLSAQTA